MNPQPCLLEVERYVIVTGFKVCDFAMLIGGSDFGIYELPADSHLQALMIDVEKEFSQRMLDAAPPDPINVADLIPKSGR